MSISENQSQMRIITVPRQLKPTVTIYGENQSIEFERSSDLIDRPALWLCKTTPNEKTIELLLALGLDDAIRLRNELTLNIQAEITRREGKDDERRQED